MKQNKMHRKEELLKHWFYFNEELRLRNGESVGYYAKCNCYKPWECVCVWNIYIIYIYTTIYGNEMKTW